MAADALKANDVRYGSVLSFTSRRSPLLCLNAAVCCSQPTAAAAGIEVLKSGGNAADAAVAVAAALNVTEPTSTGIGGDCFAIFYDARTRVVSGLNGSGRAPAALSPSSLPSDHRTGNAITAHSVHAITVPGAAGGWCDTVQRWGRLPLSEVLAPAIAEGGFAVAPITAESWSRQETLLRRHRGGRQLLTADGRAPRAGEIFRNPNLAKTFRLLADGGADAFYRGPIADAVIALTKECGGFHTHEDLANHRSTFPTPVSVSYRGVNVYELPPNGQGITALIALNLLKQFQSKYEHSSAQHLHLIIECLRLAFADTRRFVADPDHVHVPVEQLLSDEYAARRAKLINLERATIDQIEGTPFATSNTVSFCVVDESGNACSFINSNYQGFGSAYAPDDTGFTLQNRGANFSLVADHPNILAGGKRPYHTIIPGLCTMADGTLLCPFSVMGAFMQPQGHVQLLVNMIDYAIEPQRALDLPRFCIEDGESGGDIAIEDGIDEQTIQRLRSMGHRVRRLDGWARAMFGRGQVIVRASNGVLWCGSDGRADGCALGY